MDKSKYTLRPSELISGGCLRHDHETTLIWIMFQLMDGLAYLHHIGVFHRDIKPENILVYSHTAIKIADFGACRTRYNGNSRSYTADQVTLCYRAPEIVVSRFYNEKVDVFAAAITMLDIIKCLHAHKNKYPINSNRYFDTFYANISNSEIMKIQSTKLSEYKKGIKPIWDTQRRSSFQHLALADVVLEDGEDYGGVLNLIRAICPQVESVLTVSYEIAIDMRLI